MAKFRKKPVVVEAVQFDHTDKPWPDGVNRYSEGFRGYTGPSGKTWGYIEMMDGEFRRVKDGDWVVTESNGDRYPLDDDHFRSLYNPVED